MNKIMLIIISHIFVKYFCTFASMFIYFPSDEIKLISLKIYAMLSSVMTFLIYSSSYLIQASTVGFCCSCPTCTSLSILFTTSLLPTSLLPHCPSCCSSNLLTSLSPQGLCMCFPLCWVSSSLLCFQFSTQMSKYQKYFLTIPNKSQSIPISSIAYASCTHSTTS